MYAYVYIVSAPAQARRLMIPRSWNYMWAWATWLGWWEPNSDSLQEQYRLLTAETTLPHPSFTILTQGSTVSHSLWSKARKTVKSMSVWKKMLSKSSQCHGLCRKTQVTYKNTHKTDNPKQSYFHILSRNTKIKNMVPFITTTSIHSFI